LLEEGFDADTVIAKGLVGSPDETIYDTCKAVGRTPVTLDLDFSNPLRFPPEDSEGICRCASAESVTLVDSGDIKPPFDLLKGDGKIGKVKRFDEIAGLKHGRQGHLILLLPGHAITDSVMQRAQR
jgi:hypothetical protein